ncbi:MAG: NADH-quinone oxidoreductase subunit NuoE [Candidatus Helarchaeota archaeon]|nr:NADH-quinone oxidoreductase subunit NuoE [Candidatus Helarchaeota archaeon]
MNSYRLQKINDNRKEEIDKIIEIDKNEDGTLISLLQKIQDYYHYLPPDVLNYISEQLKIPPAEIYSIATFYMQFKLTPLGKYVITCCEGTACHVKGSQFLLVYLENSLGIKAGETTEDKLFSLQSVACLGCCAISPVCIINDQVYGNLNVKKISKLLSKFKKEI